MDGPVAGSLIVCMREAFIELGPGKWAREELHVCGKQNAPRTKNEEGKTKK
jgi:hypothetical protein